MRASSAALDLWINPYRGTSTVTATSVSQVLSSPGLAIFALYAVNQQLSAMNDWSDNWDGYGSRRPNFEAISAARDLLTVLYEAAAPNNGWSDPHLSADEQGSVVMEWWQDYKKITLYVTPTETSYVRVWGDDIDTEMDEGLLTAPSYEFGALWSWLRN
jgi:hypothetical protein